MEYCGIEWLYSWEYKILSWNLDPTAVGNAKGYQLKSHCVSGALFVYYTTTLQNCKLEAESNILYVQAEDWGVYIQYTRYRLDWDSSAVL